MGQSTSQMTGSPRTSRFMNAPATAAPAEPRPSPSSSPPSSSSTERMEGTPSRRSASPDRDQPKGPFGRRLSGLMRSSKSKRSNRDASASTSSPSRFRRMLSTKDRSRTSSSSSPSPSPSSSASPNEVTTSSSSGPSSSRSSRRPWPLSSVFSKASDTTQRGAEEAVRESTLSGSLSETPEPSITEPSTAGTNEAPPPPPPPPQAPVVEPVAPSDSEAPTAAPTDSTTHAATTAPTNAPVNPRTFPPAGTLVVVQGVVHTTDADLSRPSAAGLGDSASTATPSDSRASSVPRSARRHFSRLSRTPSRGPPAVPADVEAGPSTSSGENTLSPFTATGEASSMQASTPPDHASEANSRPPPLSPSSIDVLGTLLSVAAAATAASLVTGSSAPLLSSGLAHPGPNTQPLSAEDTLHPSRREMDATPLGDRRRPWENWRDRLRPGRPASQAGQTYTSPSPTPGDGTDEPGTETAVEPGANANPVDAREQMLQDMVRALNHGLGGNPASGIRNADSGALGSSPPAPSSSQSLSVPRTGAGPVHPNGSFEQFLVNMQTDLRRTLREGEDEPAGDGVGAHPAGDDDLLRDLMGIAHPEVVSEPNSEAGLRTRPSSQDAIADAFFPAPHNPPRRRHSARSPARRRIPRHRSFSLSEDHPRAPMQPMIMAGGSQPADSSTNSTTIAENTLSVEHNPNRASYSSMPGLQNVSDTEDEDTESDEQAEQRSSHYLAIPSAHPAAEPISGSRLHEHGHPTFVAPPPPPPGRTGERNINWWRMYRFPPMVAPQGASPSPATTTAVPTPGETTPMPVTPVEPSTAALSAALPQTSPSPPQPQPETVVPVIVVGLQSVNFRRGGENDDGPTANVPGMGEVHLGEGMGAGEEAPQRGRGTGWPSRAANAIHRLRHGRRTEQRHNEPMGARTFLIYVIGGYYPPNHQIVTGNGALDSFEALLELADLLGQVKPPTVTTEEINQAGLEVINPSKLSEYEAAGKVASNCVDRCLICLDDYEKTDELRILGCKHTFHKGCVDRWMSTGRNNCPACRSQGVPVPESSDESNSASLPTEA